MENQNNARTVVSQHAYRQFGLGLVLFFSLSGTLWAPVNPGWCKNNTTLNPIANLSFGAFASSGTGQVIVSVGGVRTSTGGVNLMGGTVRQAAFNINGCADKAYSIIVPPDSPLTFDINTMTVTAFISFPASSGILDASGAGALQFGASLNVNYPQIPGSYTGTYPVEIVVQ